MDLKDSEFDSILNTLAGRTLSIDQFKMLSRAMQSVAAIKRNIVKRTLYTGDKVKWQNKYGRTRTGVLIRKMTKNAEITADDDGRRWRVPMSILEPDGPTQVPTG